MWSWSRPLVLAVIFLAAGSACAPADEAAPQTRTTSSSSPTSGDPCAKDALPLVEDGQLTIGTDKPAYDPWFSDNDPTNGKGFESAVAYAVAAELGFVPDEVAWTVVPFNSSYAPGEKDFDFDINQISITEKRKRAVDFSRGYYTVNQAVVALNDSPVANATTVADLKDAKLGAQVGTTSLDAIEQIVQPSRDPFVYNDTNDAKAALQNGQIDGIVVDLPTAFYLTAAEIDDSTIVGQFDSPTGAPEQFGLLFEKGNPLVRCVDTALEALESSGQLQEIQDRWLAQAAGAPKLQ